MSFQENFQREADFFSMSQIMLLAFCDKSLSCQLETTVVLNKKVKLQLPTIKLSFLCLEKCTLCNALNRLHRKFIISKCKTSIKKVCAKSRFYSLETKLCQLKSSNLDQTANIFGFSLHFQILDLHSE